MSLDNDEPMKEQYGTKSNYILIIKMFLNYSYLDCYCKLLMTKPIDGNCVGYLSSSLSYS